jgi:hypothetical protein
MSEFFAEMIGQFDQISVGEAFGDPGHDGCRAIALFEVLHGFEKQTPVHPNDGW